MVSRKTNPRTRIVEVQKRWESAFYHRLVRSRPDSRRTPLKSAIRERVIDDDALGLSDRLLPDGGTLTAQDGFDFPENPRRAAEFETWLESKIASDVLDEAGRDLVIEGEHWTGEHIRDASRQGIRHGDRELRRAGVAPRDEPVSAVLRAPVHRDVVQSGYLRAYDELDGISREMGTEISRSMSDGLAQGWGPRKTASEMNSRVDTGLTRTRRLARTESSRVYNDHSLARYGEHGVGQVRVLTYEPCSVCEAIAADGPYDLDEARGLIPGSTHPNCVCSLSPVV